MRIPDADGFKLFEKLPAEPVAGAENPDVTVVTVVFNAVKSGRAKEFAQCLESVQSQRGCTLEHVVVDGGSRDGTVKIAEDSPVRTVPVRYVSEPDHGIYEAMNRGIALSRGRYVVFLNSDDFFNDPEGMAESVRALDASGADFSYARANVIDDAGSPVDHVFTEADEAVTMLHGMTICHQTILFRRSVLMDLDGYDLAYRSASDYDLFLRFIYDGHKGVRVDRRFATFRAGGFSSVNADLSEKEVDSIFQKLLGERLRSDIAGRAVRVMRETGEYPSFLLDRILAVGRASFVGASMAACAPTPVWAHRSYGELVYAVRDWILSRHPTPFRFMLSHPKDCLAALKALALGKHSGEFTLKDAIRDRCELLALDNFTFTSPRDIAKGDSRVKCFRYGIGCVGSFTVRSVGRKRGNVIALFLSECAYCTKDGSFRVTCNGRDLGVVGMRLLEKPRLHVFRLPADLRGGGDLTVEIVSENGCDFVFGGLAIGCEA